MTTYLDFTGTDPNYLVSDHRIVISTLPGNTSFVVPLVRPAYSSTLKIYYSDTYPLVQLNPGIDYTIRTSDIAYDAMGKAKVGNRDFDDQLIHSVTMLMTPPEDVEISLAYNTLEMSYITHNTVDLDNIELTPELIHELSQTIAYLRDTRNPIENLLSDTVAVSPTLDVDLTGSAPSNLIPGEIHGINAQSGRVYIRPVAGSFYRDSVVIRVVSTNTLLVPGTDYRVIGNNTVKTTQTSNTSGVYDVIFITAALVGNVSVTYQAFGGEVSRKDIDNMFNVMVNVVEYINNAAFLNPNTVGSTPVFLQLINRIQNLEETVRILSTGGTPTYTDSTNGKAFNHKFASPDSVNKHWYTIARLYRVAGSTEVYKKSQCRFKIMCALSGLMFDVLLSVDINNSVKPIQISVLGSNDAAKYTPYTEYGNIDTRIQPEFRIIWNEEVNVNTGTLLQIGFNLKNIAIETVGIEDLSGSESCWIASTANVAAVGPADDLITLPNGTAIWSSGSAASKSAIATYTPARGYLAWAGTTNLNLCDLGSGMSAITLSNGLLSPVDVHIGNIKKVQFHIWDRVNGKMIISECPVAVFGTKINCSTMFYPADLCSVTFTLTQAGNTFTLSLSCILGNASYENSIFEIREITLAF